MTKQVYGNCEPRFIALIQGSDEWKNFRKMKIGSSMAASIRGVGFKTPLQLFEDILEDRETPVNDAMMRGTLLEPKAREWLNNKYKSNLQPAVVQHPVHDWHISSLDGIWKTPKDEWFVCEIKCPGREDHEIAKKGTIPEKYRPQLFHILEDLPNVQEILYLSYHEESQFEVWLHREYCIDFIDTQLKAEKEFYERLINCTPPEPGPKDWIEYNSPDIVCKAKMYSFMMDQISEMQEQALALKKEIIDATEAANRAKIGDLRLQKVIRQGNVDYSRVEALKGIDLNPYRKEPIVSWRLS